MPKAVMSSQPPQYPPEPPSPPSPMRRDPHWSVVLFALGSGVVAAVLLSVVGGSFLS